MKRIPTRVLIESARAGELLGAAGCGAVLMSGVLFPSFVTFLIGAGIVVGVITFSLWRDNLIGHRETTDEQLLQAPQRTRDAYDASIDAIAGMAEALTNATACIDEMNQVMIEQTADVAAVMAERDQLLRVSAHIDEIREVVQSPRRITMAGVMAESGPAIAPTQDLEPSQKTPHWLGRPPLEPSIFAPRRSRQQPNVTQQFEQQLEETLREPMVKTAP